MRAGGSGLSGFAAGLLLLGFAAVPIVGCSQLTGARTADDPAASASDSSSMKLQGNEANTPSTDDALAAAGPVAQNAPQAPVAAPAVVQALAIPAPIVPIIPPVTSPTIPALALAAPVSPSPIVPANLGQPNPGTAVVASIGHAPVLNVASTGTPVLKGLSGNGMQGTARTLNPVMMRALKEFQVASASFPDFCRDWSRKLSVREHDNLGQIKWVMQGGVETGSYVGYSSIDSCTCKEATNGVAVGILTYKEFEYTLSGKSVEEARHAAPHATAVVPTREIFAYEKGKWFW
jgi:hypothetical protein